MHALKSYAGVRISGVFALLLVAALSVGFAEACTTEEPTATPVPPTATSVPPTATSVPPTEAPEEAMEPTGEPIRIGTLIDATGDLAAFGPPIVLATDLAALLVNEAGGIDGRPIEMVHRDSGTSPQIATDAASALVNVDGVEAIVGSLSSGVTLAVAESVTIPGGAVLVSPASTSPAITNLDDDDTVYRTTVSDALQGVIAAQLASQLGYDNVATLYINNAYGEGLSTVFESTFESLGGTVYAAVPIEGGQASYVSELRQASQGGATVLMAISYPETAGVYLREAVEGQFFEEFMFVDGTKNQEMFDTLGADSFEGNYGTAPGAPGTPTQE
ncbi:MAG: ABC transporter substrate-binding protein, partial [Chloroflexi bacterium]|nr:ABC transporter substrate-binding protein [Chloroflexota bacterium]